MWFGEWTKHDIVVERKDIKCSRGRDSQSFVHFVKGFLSLLKEVQDQGLGKLALCLILVHFQDLGESLYIDTVAKVRQSGILGLKRTNA